MEILYRSGPAGVQAGLQVYEQNSDPTLGLELQEYLLVQQQADKVAGGPGDSLERAQARHRIAEYLK